MAEALGIAGSAVGIVSLGIQISQGILSYYGDWKDRDADVLRMYQATDDLSRIFMFLKVTLNDNVFEYNVVDIVERSIMSCESEVLKLERKLGKLKRLGGVGFKARLHDQARRALYPFKTQSLAKLTTIVNNMRDSLSLALGALQTRTTLALLDQSGKIATALDQMHSGCKETTLLLSKAQLALQIEQIEKRRKEIMIWISGMGFANKQYETLSTRQEGTGDWLLDRSEFQSWTKGAEERRILWCPGIPGAGKTVLAATIIDYLQWNFQSSQVAVVYIYCDYRLQREQTLEALLASILSQLVDGKPSIPEVILKCYELHKTRKTRPTGKEYLNLLQEVIAQFSSVFIVLDALDECEESLRSRFVKDVRGFQENTRILCTSRFLPDIMTAFDDVRPWLEIAASEADMRKYISGRIEQVMRLQRHVQAEAGLFQEIEARIIELAEGMFLVARLHLDELAKKQTRKAIRTALQELPKGISENYDAIMDRIGGQEEEDAMLARRALSWISFSLRPLSITELQHAIQIQVLDPDEDDVGEADVADPHTILAVCAGLIILDADSGIVRLVHPSTQEYFDRKRSDIFPDAHHEMTISCLRCLTLPAITAKLATVLLTAITDSAAQVRKEVADLPQRYPLLFYATAEWRNHAENYIAEISSNSPDSSNYWGQLLKQSLQAGNMSNVAKLQGIDNIAIMLLVRSTDADEADPPQRWIAMSWSSHNGQFTTIPFQMSKEFLAGKRIPGNPLLGSSKSSQLLLEAPTNTIVSPIWTTDKSKDTAWRPVRSILYGADATHAFLLKALFSNGAELKYDDAKGSKYLWEATADFGYMDVAEMLISNGHQANTRDYRGQTPLFHAATCGHSDMVDMLVLNGAEVNARDRSNRTPIFQAALFGHSVVIDRLVANGAEVDARDINGCTALCFIAKAETKRPSFEAVKKLIAHGSNPNTKDNTSTSPLAHASTAGEMGLVELLVASGADVDIISSAGPTVLSYAILRGKMGLAKRLLTDARNDSKEIFGSPPLLLDAVLRYDVGQVESLLTNTKIDIEACSTLLEFALMLRTETIISSLVLHIGEDNRFRLNGASILSWAVMLGEESLVELLLKNGIDSNSEISDGLTPLLLAVVTGQRRIVKVLLAHGADIHSKGCDGNVPLDCILVENGVNWKGLITRWSGEAHEIQQLDKSHRGGS